MNSKLLTVNKGQLIIGRGGIVAVPTETVYGLAASALSEAAVRRMYELKGRPAEKPLPILVRGAEAIEEYCLEAPRAAYTLADKFWPGPLTIVLKARAVIPAIVRAGGDTIGLRCPDHPLTLELLRKTGLPLAAPSANPSGLPSPKTAADVLAYFPDNIDGVLDGGACSVGVESTVIDLSAAPYRILREGALSGLEIGEALAEKLTVVGLTGGSGAGKTTALGILHELGAYVIDCDVLYHELLESDLGLRHELEARFPAAFVSGDFDRKALGGMVFTDRSALSILNEITHRHVLAAVRSHLADFAMSGGMLAAIDAIALIESGLAGICRFTVGILAPRADRVARIVLRENVTGAYARLRIDAQKDDEFYRNGCDHILVNDGGEARFKAHCREFFKMLLKQEE